MPPVTSRSDRRLLHTYTPILITKEYIDQKFTAVKFWSISYFRYAKFIETFLQQIICVDC
jgi:hypothetical protein